MVEADVGIETGGDVHAGDEGTEVTITYTAIGQIVGGKLKVTVPADWSDAMAANFSLSPSFPAKYGADEGATGREADDDFTDGDDGMRELVISGINLRDEGNTLTITYTTDIQLTAGDATFKFAFDGSHGPDKVLLNLAGQTVEVMGAADGSGTPSISQDPGKIVAGSTGNTITITYIAQGEIGAGRKVTVEVPDGWSEPSTTADAAGEITVLHEEADEDATSGYTEVKDRVAGSVTVTDDEMEIVVTVAAEQTVEQGDRITITYANATAPAAPEKSAFKVFLGDTAVDDPLNVLVESAGDASVIDIVSEESFMIDDGGTLTVTVKLLDSDGNFATRSTPTTVTLNDGGAGGSFESRTVTIPASEYHAETTYSATEAARVTITATTTATGLTDAEPLMVLADTNSPSIDADSITADPMYAKEDTTVTVSATGTKARAATTVLFSIHIG